jgi:hypothetical protein
MTKPQAAQNEQLEFDFGGGAMGKVESSSERPDFYAKGGPGSMFGKGGAGKAAPGQSGKDSNSPPGASEKWASGGSGKMFGKGKANKAESGQSGKSGQ